MSQSTPQENTKFQNKRNYAVALYYGQDDNAPRVLAAGPGEIAKKIVELAEESGVPIKRDDTVVEILSKIEVGVTIPMECYQSIAEIFAFLFRMDMAWREKKLQDYPEFVSR